MAQTITRTIKTTTVKYLVSTPDGEVQKEIFFNGRVNEKALPARIMKNDPDCKSGLIIEDVNVRQRKMRMTQQTFLDNAEEVN